MTHPNPQMRRENYVNLNGEWEFEFDFGNSGVNREMFKNCSVFSKKITVPFCVESELSGIGYKEFYDYLFNINIEVVDYVKKKCFFQIGFIDFSPVVAIGALSILSSLINQMLFYGRFSVGYLLAFCADYIIRYTEAQF